MADTASWRNRAQNKRRNAAVERALEYLTIGLAGLSGRRKGTAEKQVRESSRPMATAKALVTDWRKHSGPRAATLNVDRPSDRVNSTDSVGLDFSAATEARTILLRRQPLALQDSPAYEDELKALERSLLKGSLSQRAFVGRCQKIGERVLPKWMIDYKPAPYPIPRATTGMAQRYDQPPDEIDMPPIPENLRR